MNRHGMTIAALLVVFCIAGPAAAEIVEIELPATLGNHAIDLGFPVAMVHSASLHVSGEARRRYYHCIHDGPGGHHEYDHDEPQRLYGSVISNGEQMDTDFWYFGNGEFAADMPFVIWGDDGERLLADGTGTLVLESWIELFPPESEECSITDPGSLDLDDPLVLTLDIDRVIPVTRSTWSVIKAAYR